MADEPIPAGAVSLKAGEVKVIHDVASIFHMSDVGGNVYYTLQFAAVPIQGIFATGVHGHKIVTEEPPFIVLPAVLTLSDGQNIIIGAVKHRGDQSYYYGVPANLVKDFSSTDEKSFKEATVWNSWRVSDERIQYASALENNASAKLLDNFLKILKLTPSFASQKLFTLAAIGKWCHERSFKDVVKAVCLQGEKVERGVAQGHAASADLGKDCKERWQAVFNALLGYKVFYQEAFAQRFMVFENPEALDAVLKDLSGSAVEGYLAPALRKHAASGSTLSAVPSNTPLKNLLEKPPPAAPPAAAPPPPAAAAAAAAADDDDEDGPAAEGAAEAAAAAPEEAEEGTEQGGAEKEAEQGAEQGGEQADERAGSKRRRTPTPRLQDEVQAPKQSKNEGGRGARGGGRGGRGGRGARGGTKANEAKPNEEEPERKRPPGRPPNPPKADNAASMKLVEELQSKVSRLEHKLETVTNELNETKEKATKEKQELELKVAKLEATKNMGANIFNAFLGGLSYKAQAQPTATPSSTSSASASSSGLPAGYATASPAPAFNIQGVD